MLWLTLIVGTFAGAATGWTIRDTLRRKSGVSVINRRQLVLRWLVAADLWVIAAAILFGPRAPFNTEDPRAVAYCGFYWMGVLLLVLLLMVLAWLDVRQVRSALRYSQELLMRDFRKAVRQAQAGQQQGGDGRQERRQGNRS